MAFISKLYQNILQVKPVNIIKRLASVQIDGKRNEDEIVKENWKKRCELATAYRALEKYDMGEGVCNHLTAKAPSVYQKEPVILIIPYGTYWADVTPECLAGISIETAELIEGSDPPEPTAHSIHRSMYRHRPDVNAVMHAHPMYATILSVLMDPELKMVHQNCIRFYERIEYDTNYEGISLDGVNTESERLGRQMTDQSKSTLVMGNHGLLTVAESISLAFDRLYYFERAARNLVLAYQTGKELRPLDTNVIISTRDLLELNEEFYADGHFHGIAKRLMKEDPTFLKTDSPFS